MTATGDALESQQIADSPTRPFRQIVIKIHSRCNLACDHCYVYQHADQSWRRRSVVMTRPTLARIAARIGEHAYRHRLPSMHVILHGGEPLLAGADFIEHATHAIRAAVPVTTGVAFTVQTNGTLLNEEMLDVLHRAGVRVGISLDGDRTANDRHRRYASGRSSYGRVERALRLLSHERRRHLYAGILCTIDVRNDPVETYQHLLGFAPPAVDLLLPHGNHDTSPPYRPADTRVSPYADWLIAVFDHWYDAPRQETRIRLFESIIDLLLGRHSHSESVGLGPIDILTVETDGSLEQSDALKTTVDGMAATGMHVDSHSFDDAATHPGIHARRAGIASLSATCRQCPIMRICGGGLYAHRYRADSGFDNPSIYCPDLYRLIVHIHGRLRDHLSARLRRAQAGST